MNDTMKPPAGAHGRAGADNRLTEIERRVARVEERGGGPDDRLVELSAELAQLRQAVADLATDNRELHALLDRLVSSCDRLVGGSMAGAAGIRPSGGLRESASMAKRAAHRAVRGTVGVARRLVSGPRSSKAAAADVRLRFAEKPVVGAPRFAVVARTSADPESGGASEILRRQTDSSVDLVVWNEGLARAVLRPAVGEPTIVEAPDREAVAAAVSADWIADVGSGLRGLHPSVVERCRWVVASEGLPLVVGASQRSPGWRVEPVGVWAAASPDGSGASTSELEKAVGTGGWGVWSGPGYVSVAGGVGRGYLPARSSGPVKHTVSPLDGVVAAHPAEDERLPILVMTSSRGAALAAWALRGLAADFRFTVVVTDGADGSPAVRALTELADRTYPLEGFLEPEVWPSAAADLVRAHGIAALLRIDTGSNVPIEGSGARVVDLPFASAAPGGEADLVVALGRELAEGTRAGGIETVELVPGPAPSGEMPAAEELAVVRSSYGIPEDARLVVSVCDLEPDDRPEDVAAVAKRLEHRPDIHVLLVGRGSLAGTVSDLAGYLGLERFTLAPPGHSATDIVAMSDCLLGTAEIDPWPVSVGEALALGRSVVATEIDGVRELCADADFDRCVLCPPGDVDALAAAVVDAVDTKRAPRMTRKAWNAASKRNRDAARILADALRPPPTGGAEGAD